MPDAERNDAARRAAAEITVKYLDDGPLKHYDQIRERSGSENFDADKPLLIGVREVCHLVGCGRTLWLSLVSAGKTPAPVRLGQRTLWRREKIEGWVKAGCPVRTSG